MTAAYTYDVAVIGGGLAGLSLSIQMAKAGRSVILFEKETYPFHKVCGEYISMESWEFLVSLGVDLPYLNLPKIDTLLLTAPDGTTLTAQLPLGGFGISRFRLDASLASIAKKLGVTVMDATKVESVEHLQGAYKVKYKNTMEGVAIALICCSAFGKRSNLDVKWKRSFLASANKKLDNYIGVKYHVKAKGLSNVIALHNFKDGYCGFSKIEDGVFCLCYMTTADNLKSCGNSIQALQEKILSKNPVLKKVLSESEVVEGFPVVISQINFNRKSPVENGILMLGDAAGTITPLCGNGMSMALHSSKLAASLMNQFFEKDISKTDLDSLYSKQWNKEFGGRIRLGRRLQAFFGSTVLSTVFIMVCKTFPFIIRPLIRKTHGRPF